MHTGGQNETLGFNGLSGYYGSLQEGYGGFDFVDVDYLNATYWKDVKTNWCETGFQNVIRGSGEAYIAQDDMKPTYAILESAERRETFSLQSMWAASAWDSDQSVTFQSAVYRPHHGFELKASVTIDLGQTAQKIDFAKMGNDFKNISAVAISVYAGSAGNSCSYGAPTYGYAMAFDNLKVHWNGKIPGSAPGRGGHSPAGLSHHIIAAHAQHIDAPDSASHVAAAHDQSATYHSMLASLDTALGHADPAGGLTAQFALPQPEHFGP